MRLLFLRIRTKSVVLKGWFDYDKNPSSLQIITKSQKRT